MQIVQELCRRPGLNKAGFEMMTIYVPTLQEKVSFFKLTSLRVTTRFHVTKFFFSRKPDAPIKSRMFAKKSKRPSSRPSRILSTVWRRTLIQSSIPSIRSFTWTSKNYPSWVTLKDGVLNPFCCFEGKLDRPTSANRWNPSWSRCSPSCCLLA